jgi:hypothetical protein
LGCGTKNVLDFLPTGLAPTREQQRSLASGKPFADETHATLIAFLPMGFETCLLLGVKRWPALLIRRSSAVEGFGGLVVSTKFEDQRKRNTEETPPLDKDEW